MKRWTVKSTLIAAFFIAVAVVATFEDYGEREFGLNIQYTPLVVWGLIAAFFTWQLASVIARSRPSGVRLAARIFPLVGALGAFFAQFSISSPFELSGEPWASIRRSIPFGVWSVGWLIAPYIVIGILVLGVPIWAIIASALQLTKRNFNTAALYLGVPLLGIGLYFAGRSIADFILVQTMKPAIQFAIRDVRSGRSLPSSSMFMVSAEPDLAAFVNSSDPVGTQYLVYDGRDVALDSASRRIAKFLNRGCDLRVRPIVRSYYMVNSC